MKNFIALLFSVIFILITSQLSAQGYFVSSSGNYLSPEKFKTNIQNDLSKYVGSYTAVSETYESSYTYLITSRENALDILIIGGACMDGENWQWDSTYVKGVNVKDGAFALDNNSIGFGNSGNTNFRFVKVTYKLDGKSVKAEGLVMEEYFMFAEKEK